LKFKVSLLLVICILGMPAIASAANNVYSLDQNGVLRNPSIPAKTVVLTFDDGPSKYTPQVLSILQSKHVHATFFVIGKEAAYSKQLKALYDAGDDIGNHTYTHPDLTMLPLWRVQLELGLDRLIIESQTGHSTRLLRLPYLGSDNLTFLSSSLIKTVDGEGYITIGEDVDTSDWRRPGVPNIVDSATAQANGGIILLHDGGGDRSQTIKALPEIIDYYQARGYQFMTVSQALGLPREQLMPKLSRGDMVLSHLALIVFDTSAFVGNALYFVILLLIIASFGRMILVLTAANVQARRKPPPLVDGNIPCSVVVPAYNEAKVIQSCLKSILASHYDVFEVIVIDDGSLDNTVQLAEAMDDHRLRVLRKPNGGKSSALNYGIEQARGKFIVAIDADTVFRTFTLRRLMRHFHDPKVGAVSGNTRIINRRRLITKLQSLEYIVGFNLDRRMGDLFDCITVVPGAVGAFRKSALEQVGGFAHDTLAEDTDLTLSIQEAHYRIVYDADAIAYTEAPATIRELLKQRFRWTFGTMQAVWKHKRAMLNPHYGTVGMIGLPYLLLFQIIFPLVGPLFDASLIIGLLSHRYHLVLLSFAIYTAADIVMCVTALRLDGERLRQIWLILPQRVYYRQLMYYVIVRSAINVLKGHLVGWGSLKREGKDLERVSS